MRLVIVLALVGCKDSSTVRTYKLDELPITEWTSGLPVSGDGKLVVALTPREITDWTKAKGYAEFTCDGCTLGDDKAQMKIDFMGESGLDFGRITFGIVRARVDFGAGGVRVTAKWGSPDMTLDADIRGVLAPNAEDIALEGCVVFGPTKTLLERDPKLHALISTTGAPMREDGKYTIKIEGTLGKMRRLGQVCAVPSK